jgi:hypothetical protein
MPAQTMKSLPERVVLFVSVQNHWSCAGALPRGRYQQAVFSALEGRLADVNNLLLDGGFRLIPSPYRLWPLCNGMRNLLGILITTAFLSLGAPFWFNSLKGLSNLRTVLAENERKETAKA